MPSTPAGATSSTWPTPSCTAGPGSSALGPNDNVIIGNQVFVPFGPFPAFVLLPIVAIFGPDQADHWQPVINAALAAIDLGLCWWLAARLGVRSLVDRLWLCVLFGFSTQIWWVTTRGGVWHTGHLVATGLSLMALIELFGRGRPLLVGMLGGAAFLTRAPLVLAMPVYALMLGSVDRAIGAGRSAVNRWRPVLIEWLLLGLGFLPFLLFDFWYNDVRFGSIFESGYGLASLPDWLEALREQGLFSLSHLGMNIDYLFLHTPTQIPDFPFFQPDGLGMSDLDHQPGPVLGGRGRAGPTADLAPAGRPGPDPRPEPAVLRRRLAPVRLSLCARRDALRDGPVLHRGGPPRRRLDLARGDRVRGDRRPRRGLLGLPPVGRSGGPGGPLQGAKLPAQ